MIKKYFPPYFAAISIIFCVFIGCELEDPIAGVKSKDVVSLSIEKDGIETDRIYSNGVDFVNIIAKLGNASDPNMKVLFKTDNGSFAGIPSDQADKQTFSVIASGKEARAVLISGVDVAPRVTISAWVEDFTDEKTIEFVRALPNDLLIESDKLKIKADNSDKAVITAQLFRDLGKVSTGTRVLFTATAQSDNEVDVYIPQWGNSDVNEKVSIEIKGKGENNTIVVVTATVDKDGGGKLSKSIKIELEGVNP